jgi:hypothetical protein
MPKPILNPLTDADLALTRGGQFRASARLAEPRPVPPTLPVRALPTGRSAGLPATPPTRADAWAIVPKAPASGNHAGSFSPAGGGRKGPE